VSREGSLWRGAQACGRGGERLLARAAAHGDSQETTSVGDGTAPKHRGTRGKDSDEVSDAGVLGRRGERTSTERMPGVRRNVVDQSTGDNSREEQDKVDVLLCKAQEYAGRLVASLLWQRTCFQKLCMPSAT
jgi:hypothetical protein